MLRHTACSAAEDAPAKVWGITERSPAALVRYHLCHSNTTSSARSTLGSIWASQHLLQRFCPACSALPVLTSTTHFSSLKGTICTGLIFHFNLLIFGSILQFLLLILDFSPAHEDAWRQHLQPLQATFFFIIQAMKENIK